MTKQKRKYERPSIKAMEASMPSKAGCGGSVSHVREIDGVSIEAMVGKYGSPLFVFSEKKIRENIKCAKTAFQSRYPSVTFAWSYKTNYLSRICKVFHEEGSWAEVVSGYEYQRAIDNGVDPSRIIFNGPSKTDDDLTTAVNNDSIIHIDNLLELNRLCEIVARIGKKARVGIRVNLEVDVYPRWSRFGFNLENGEAMAAVEKVLRSEKIMLEGIHCHIGTFVLSLDAYRLATKKMAEFASIIEEKFSTEIRYIDMGGGFASKNTLKGTYGAGEDLTPSFDDYAVVITNALLGTKFRNNHHPMLVLETGRALIDDAGFLATSVIAHKHLPDGTSNTIIDAGVNLLFTSFWYNHKISPVSCTTQRLEATKLTGPLCMNIDVVRERVVLPLAGRGDILMIHNVGAYNVSQWMQFIEYRPSVAFVKTDGSVSVIRNRETMEAMTNLEIIE